jgi:hypothetical protein
MLRSTQNAAELRDFENFVPVMRRRSTNVLVVAI